MPSNPADPRERPRRLLAMHPSGHVVSAMIYRYEIEAWDADGRRVGGFKGPVLTEGTPSGAFRLDNPPPDRIYDLGFDDGGRLWVLSVHLRSDWLDRVDERPGPGGMVLAPKVSVSSVYTSRIDVIDLDRAEIVGTTEHDGMLVRMLGEGHLAELRTTESLVPQVIIWQASFER